MTRTEQIEFLDKHAKAISFVTDEAFQGRRPVRVVPAPVGAVLARAYYTEDHAKLSRFAAVLLGETPNGASETGPHLLRSWLLSGGKDYIKDGVRISHEVTVYQKAQRAVALFLKGESMRSLISLREEQWPLPGEAPRRKKSQFKEQQKG
jgi:hypothetical protein